MKLVLDASAAIATVLGRPPAARFLESLSAASVVIAPDLYVSEVANGLWKYVAAREITGHEASESLDAALHLVDRFVAVADIAQEALREASSHRHPVYDLCYVIAARREGCAVLTLDARLRRLLAAMRIPAAPAAP